MKCFQKTLARRQLWTYPRSQTSRGKGCTKQHQQIPPQGTAAATPSPCRGYFSWGALPAMQGAQQSTARTTLAPTSWIQETTRSRVMSCQRTALSRSRSQTLFTFSPPMALCSDIMSFISARWSPSPHSCFTAGRRGGEVTKLTSTDMSPDVFLLCRVSY